MAMEDHLTYEQLERLEGYRRTWADIEALTPEDRERLRAKAEVGLDRPRGRGMTGAEFLAWYRAKYPSDTHAG